MIDQVECQYPLQQIPQEDERGHPCSHGPEHIGGSDIVTAIIPDIDPADQLHQKEPAGDGAQEISDHCTQYIVHNL